MKRNMIRINEDLCNGCGLCVTGCAEGALAIIDGKAKLVRDSLCDGLGACIGECPTGALTIEVREADAFDEGVVHHACPGSRVSGPGLSQWPVQLHLVSPSAPYFNDRELVVLSTCSPIASPDVHWKLIRGRSVVVLCPKLDRTESYATKLAEILAHNRIPKIHAVIMEVPCCRGLSMIVQEALALSGAETIFEQHIVTVNGHIQ